MSRNAKPAGRSDSDAEPDSTQPQPVPEQIGKYKIIRKIGSGGMGAVYLATDTQLRRQVALKVLLPEKAENPTLLRRFHAEVQAAAALKHDNIVTIYDAGTADGLTYMALEFVDGADAADLIYRRGIVPYKRAQEIIQQVAKALVGAHAQHIVHRDIKPANLLIRRDGVVKLADLGLARSLDEENDTSITRAGTTVGTVDYMSPEQARNSKLADHRSDIYSLGCTWYHLLTGKPPFPEGSLTNKLRAHAVQPPPDPRDVNDKIPEGAVAVLHRMMAKDPQDRYQSASELLADLASVTDNPGRVTAAIFGSDTDYESPVSGMKPPAADEIPIEFDDDTPAPANRRRSPDGSSSDAKSTDAKSTKKTDSRKVPAKNEDSAKNRTPASNPRKEADSGSVKRREIASDVFAVEEPGDDADSPRPKTRSSNDVDISADDEARRQRKARERAAANEREASNERSGNFKAATKPAKTDPEDGPRKRRKPPRLDEVPGDENNNSGDYGLLVYGGVITLAVLVLTGIGYLINGFANTLDQPIVEKPVAGTEQKPGEAEAAAAAAAEAEAAERAKAAEAEAAKQQANRTAATETKSEPRTFVERATAKSRREFEAELIPDWAKSVPDASGLPVRDLTAGNGETVNIEATLRELLPTGGVVRLSGTGTFVWPAGVWDSDRMLTISGNKARAALRLNNVAAEQAHSRIANGTLQLTGLDLTFSDAMNVPAAAMFRLESGRILLRDCGVSVADSMPPVRVVDVPAEAVSNVGRTCHIDVVDCWLRGSELWLAEAARPAVEILVRNSFVVSKSAGLLRLVQGTEGATRQGHVTVLSSTFSTSGSFVQWKATQPGGRVPSPEFTVVNSVIANCDSTNRHPMLGFENLSREEVEGQFRGSLRWRSAGSRFAGWGTLAGSKPDGSTVVEGAKEFAAFVQGESLALVSQFVPRTWPAEVSGQNLVELSAAAWQGRISQSGFKATDGSTAGVDPAILGTQLSNAAPRETPDRGSIEVVPAGLLTDVGVTRTVTIDLDKEPDIGRYLNSAALDTGTLVIVQGGGKRDCSPFTVRDRWLRIRFESAASGPAVLQAKVSSSPLITVQNGGLSLDGATLSYQGMDAKKLPSSMIKATNADIVLKRCRLLGPLGSNTSCEALLSCSNDGTGPEKPPSRPVEGAKQSYLAIEDSVILGGKTTLAVNMRRCGLQINNAIVFGSQTAFAWDISGNDPKIDGAARLEKVTAIANVVLDVNVDKLMANAQPALIVHAEKCVFAPIGGSDGKLTSTSLLTYTGLMQHHAAVQYSESKCGVSPEFFSMARVAKFDLKAEPQSFQKNWVGFWGADKVVQPVVGPDAVEFAVKRSAAKSRLDLADFRLLDSCKAAKADGGRAIGAELSRLPAGESKPTGGGTPEKKPPGTTKPAKPPVAGF